ncbi:MAG TPA: VacJ family lipoprotein [Dissulfurispiraceae bacterium]|nr:VacJ family lipoprotein [Dissulfurispiraceae bacterium]
MKVASILIMLSVLMLNPAVLRADTSLPAPYAEQCISPPLLIALQSAPEEDAPRIVLPDAVNAGNLQISFGEAIPVTEPQESEEEILMALTQWNAAEEGNGSIESESENIPEESEAEIADPLAPVNKVMFEFNDRLYFWGIKPVTQVYSHITPEEFRFAMSNVYDNLWAPCRMLNNLFQLRFKAAGNELIRFIFNSFAGIGGMGDMAKEALGIKKQDADFGQTLGHYGIGHGFYLVLPVFGPSSLRDGVGLAADQFMHPLTYVSSSTLTFGEKAGIFVHEEVNSTSFKIGDYEAFKEAAIDPYISMRDAFLQHRQHKVDASKQ